MTEYHHFINSQAYLFILTQQSMGGNEYGKSGHLSIFYYFETRNDAFVVLFFSPGLQFLHLIKDTDSMLGHAAQNL